MTEPAIKVRIVAGPHRRLGPVPEILQTWDGDKWVNVPLVEVDNDEYDRIAGWGVYRDDVTVVGLGHTEGPL